MGSLFLSAKAIQENILVDCCSSCSYGALPVQAGTYCDTGMVNAIPGQIRCCVTVPNRLDMAEAGEFHHFIQGMFSRPGAIGAHWVFCGQ